MTDRESFLRHCERLAAARERSKWEPTKPSLDPLSKWVVRLVQKRPDKIKASKKETTMEWCLGEGDTVSITITKRTHEEHECITLKASTRDGTCLEQRKMLCDDAFRAADYWATTWFLQLQEETEAKYEEILKRATEVKGNQ